MPSRIGRSNTETAKQLWEFATRYTPKKRVAEYTQAMMDLGALVCTRSKPSCLLCPLQFHCAGYASHNPTAYPGKKPAKQLPLRTIKMLILLNKKKEVLLEKRPPTGIWGGLWSLPECATEQDIQQFCAQQHHYKIDTLRIQPVLRHTFSHFHLEITPIVAQIKKSHPSVMESTATVWYKVSDIETKALAAPVKKLLLNIDWNAICE